METEMCVSICLRGQSLNKITGETPRSKANMIVFMKLYKIVPFIFT